MANRNLILFFLFILSISGCDASSAIPRTVDLGTVSVWSLKLASMTYALVLGDLTAFCSALDVMSDVLLGLYFTRASARTGRTPSMGMCEGLNVHKGRWFLLPLEF